MNNLIEELFSEEKRIQGLINEAINEERLKMQINEVKHLSELNIPKEKIVEVTGYPSELVDEILSN